jgi:SSS family solute:Na+ symporter
MILYLITLKTPISTIIETGLREDKFSLGSFNLDFQTSSFWVILLYGFFINLTNFGIDQNYIQRYHTASNPRDAGMSIWLCVLYYVPVSFLFFFIGTALYAFYGDNPALILELKQQVFMKTQIPTGFLGLLVAALMSAGMSTMSSGMNSSATVFLKDIYLRYIDPVAGEKKQFRVLLFATACMGGLGIVFGISMIGVKSLLDVWWKLSGIFAGGMLGIFLLGFLAKKTANFDAKIAAVLGVILIAGMSFKDNLPAYLQIPLDAKMTVVLGTLSIVGIGYFLAKIRSK